MNNRIFDSAKWFIKLRWIAISVAVITTLLAKYVLNISIQYKQIYILLIILFTINCLSLFFLKKNAGTQEYYILKFVRILINFQISFDLIILTLLLHYSGGIENPLIINVE